MLSVMRLGDRGRSGTGLDAREPYEFVTRDLADNVKIQRQ
jgi:hypothetical protein